MRRRMPGHDAVRGRSLAFFVPFGGFVFGSSDPIATVAEEHVCPGHHSSPQQISQRPFLWLGLHLSP